MRPAYFPHQPICCRRHCTAHTKKHCLPPPSSRRCTPSRRGHSIFDPSILPSGRLPFFARLGCARGCLRCALLPIDLPLRPLSLGPLGPTLPTARPWPPADLHQQPSGAACNASPPRLSTQRPHGSYTHTIWPVYCVTPYPASPLLLPLCTPPTTHPPTPYFFHLHHRKTPPFFGAVLSPPLFDTITGLCH
jgi:hypothetical protein